MNIELQHIRGLAPSLPWYRDHDPKVSIVVLNWNKPLLTIECLKSIWQFTAGVTYEVIVVDNGSRHDELKKLTAFRGAYKCVQLTVNRFFGEGNNIGAEFASGDFIVFMNNDVVVTPGWITPLLNLFEMHSDCGAAGPKLIYPNGLLQEAGALVDENGDSVQIGKLQDPQNPEFNVGRVVDYVSAATVMMRRNIFEELLGFDFVYEPAYYEDVDLCLKLGQRRLKTYYTPESLVVHHGNATTADPENGLDLSNIIAINRNKFIGRWSTFLKTGLHTVVNSPPAVIRSRTAAGSPSAALFTPYSLNPGGVERYLLSVAEVFLKGGYDTWLLTPEKYSLVRISKLGHVFGLDLQGLNVAAVDCVADKGAFDVFVAMANQITPPIAGMGKKNLFCCQFPFPCSEEEIAHASQWMKDYSSIVVYSDFVRQNVARKILRHRLPQIPLQIISPAIDAVPFHEAKLRNRIVSVGRFLTGAHCKQQAMLISAFRRLIDLGIDVELHLAGSLPTEAIHREYLIECQLLAKDLPVHFHVDASEDVLRSIYTNASIYWHGAGYGIDKDWAPEKCEHFGITVVEAMSAGVIPIVVNNGGPSTIVEHGISGYHYGSEEDLLFATLELLYAEDTSLQRLRENCRKRALDFSKESFARSWSDLTV